MRDNDIMVISFQATFHKKSFIPDRCLLAHGIKNSHVLVFITREWSLHKL